jgi:hypothetical protein
MTEHPTVKVARDLRLIVDMTTRLEAQAIAKANDRLMPGGLAMVALGTVAAPSAYADTLEAAEHMALAGYRAWPEIEDDDDFEPPLQTLLFWSEQLRAEHGYPMRARPTEATEANFLREMLDWLWENEPHFDDFAADVEAARKRMEALLVEGERPVARGVPCMYDECKGKRLVRKTVPTRDKRGNKTWRLTDWHCPSCKRSWTEEEYARNVYAAVERSHFQSLGWPDPETWCTYSRAARRVDRPEATIRSWVNRGQIASVCVPDQRTLVLVADVVARDRLAKERHARWLAVVQARRANKTTSV